MSFILGGTHEAHAAVAEPTNVTFSGFWNYKIKWKGVKNVNGYEIKVQYAYENGGNAGTYYYCTSKNTYTLNAGLTSCYIWVRSYTAGKDGKQVSRWVPASYTLW